MSRLKSNYPQIVLLSLLTLLAFSLRVTGSRSSILYIPDTQVVRQGLDIGQSLSNAASYDVGLGTNYKYPLTLSFLSLGIYGAAFVVLYATGDVHSMQDFENYLFMHRSDMHYMAIIAFAVIAAAIVPAMYFASRYLNKKHSGWLAAGLATFNLLFVHFGHHARPHVPLAALSFIAIVLLVRVGSGAGWRISLAATICSALALGTLQNGILIAIPFGLAWLVRAYSSEEKQFNWRHLLSKWVLFNLGLFVVLSLVLYPAIVREYSKVAFNILTGKPNYELGGGTHSFSSSMFSVSNIEPFIHQLYIYQPVLVILVPVAIPYFIWKNRHHPKLLIISLPFPLLNAVAWSLYSASFPRILTIVVPYLIIPAAFVLEDIIIYLARIQSIRLPKLQGVLITLLLLPLAVTAFRLVYITQHTETRTLASDWVRANIPSETTILANFRTFELTPSQDSLHYLKQTAPSALGTYEQWLMDLSPEDYPDESYWDIFFYKYYDLNTEAAVHDFVVSNDINYVLQSSLGARLADFSDPLSSYLQEYGEAVQVFCPGYDVDTVYLPDDVGELVWREVWNVERAGPFVVLWSLNDTAHLINESLPPVDIVCQS